MANLELLSAQNLHPLLTISTGVFAGLSIAISGVSAPSALDSKDPLSTWRTIYNRGSKIALSSLFISNGISIACYLNTRDTAYLPVVGASMLVPIWTLVMMKPVSDTLFKIKETTPADEVKELVGYWSQLQWVRTVVGVGAFVYTVYKFGGK